jgi:hypothetical protein
VALAFDISGFFLPSKGILVEEFIDGSVSSEPSSFLGDFGLKIFTDVAVAVIFILFIFEGVEPIENSAFFFPILSSLICFGMIGILADFLCFYTLF